MEIKSKFQTKSEEQEMYRTQPPEKVREQLIINNIKLVYQLAHRYKNSFVQFEDLRGQGILALHKAVDTFDFSRNTKFTTFAFFYIRKYIIEFINKEHRQHTISEDHQTAVLSLDSPVFEDEKTEFYSVVKEPEYFYKETPESRDEHEFILKLVKEFLTLEEQYIIKIKFLSEGKYSFGTIADSLDIPISKVKKIEKTALMKLKKLYTIFNLTPSIR